MSTDRSSTLRLFVAATAAFCTYFCMYAFRKPFTAAEYKDLALFGLGLKSVLVIAQLAGYMLSKFIGVKVVSEMRAERRAVAIIGLIAVAELALVGFAFVPLWLKPAMLFVNGLPLGMIFGLVLSYLEGRRQTEALSAALCASFIVSSGVVKSVGSWLVGDTMGVDQFQMPMYVGLIFLVPLLLSVGVLQATPPPTEEDRRSRTERPPMDGAARGRFFNAYWSGLSLLLFVYIALTVVRTLRDDFAVEIWTDMGVAEEPEVFAQSETIVAICVTALNALAILVAHNLRAMRLAFGLMCGSFVLVAASAVLAATGALSAFPFMVACGIGLYVPYVAFHTTIFERLIAASDRPCNLGFLMYLADAIGYLGYSVLLVVKTWFDESGRERFATGTFLPLFLWTLGIVAVTSFVATLLALWRFQSALNSEAGESAEAVNSPTTEAIPVTDA